MTFSWPKSGVRKLLEARVSELLAERVTMRADHDHEVEALRAELARSQSNLESLVDRVLARHGLGRPMPPAPAPATNGAPDETVPAYEPLAAAQARIAKLESEGKVRVVDGALVIDS